MDTRSRRCYRRRFLVRHAAGSLNRSSVIAKSMTGAIVVPKILTERVESLEKAVESLRELPVRVTRLEEQVLQLRSEMRDGFSAVLQVIDASSAATQRLIDDTRAEGKQEFAAVRAGIGEVRTEMRVLHEDLTHLLFEHAI
jgi:hypothetical protein